MMKTTFNLGIFCPRLSEPENGDVLYGLGYVGDTAIYSCSQGFMLIGGSSRVCEVNEIWSGTQPQCSRMWQYCWKLFSKPASMTSWEIQHYMLLLYDIVRNTALYAIITSMTSWEIQHYMLLLYDCLISLKCINIKCSCHLSVLKQPIKWNSIIWF